MRTLGVGTSSNAAPRAERMGDVVFVIKSLQEMMPTPVSSARTGPRSFERIRGFLGKQAGERLSPASRERRRERVVPGVRRTVVPGREKPVLTAAWGPSNLGKETVIAIAFSNSLRQ